MRSGKRGKRHDFLPYSISYIQSQRQDRDKLYHLKTTKFHFFSVLCYTAFKRKHYLLKANLILYIVSVMKLSSSFLSPFY